MVLQNFSNTYNFLFSIVQNILPFVNGNSSMDGQFENSTSNGAYLFPVS